MATKKNEKLYIKYMSLEALLAYPENPKTHDAESIGASYKRFGFNDPFAIDEASGYLAEGHGRLESLLQDRLEGKGAPAHVVVDPADGSWTVPVIRGVAFKSDQELRAYITAHNRLTESGGWDEKKLAVILQEAKDAGSLEGMGWTGRQVDSFLESLSPQDEITDEKPPNRNGAKQAALFSNTMRQIVLYYDTEAYESVLDRMQAVMSDNGLDSHSDVILHLLDVYDLSH